MIIYYDTESTDIKATTYIKYDKYNYDKIIYKLENNGTNTEVSATGNSLNLGRFKIGKMCENINKIMEYQNSTTVKKIEDIINDNITLF